MKLSSDWRTHFTRSFDSAEGVYVVRAVSTGEPIEHYEAAACDIEEAGATPPFPLPPRGKRTPEMVRAYNELKRTFPARAAEAQLRRTACTPERVRFEVIKTLKGSARADWVESGSLVDVVQDMTREPVQWEDEPAYYAAVFQSYVGPCGAFPARRLSTRSTYVVFVHGHWISSNVTAADSTGRWTRDGSVVTAAYLADDGAPFLAEAERLSLSPHKPPYDANAPFWIDSAPAEIDDATLDAMGRTDF